jgi:hypothetical protein
MNERMLDPASELPDDTPFDRVRFPPRIINVLTAAGVRSIGEVRETSDYSLLSFHREKSGLPRATACGRPTGSR